MFLTPPFGEDAVEFTTDSVFRGEHGFKLHVLLSDMLCSCAIKCLSHVQEPAVGKQSTTTGLVKETRSIQRCTEQTTPHVKTQIATQTQGIGAV